MEKPSIKKPGVKSLWSKPTRIVKKGAGLRLNAREGERSSCFSNIQRRGSGAKTSEIRHIYFWKARGRFVFTYLHNELFTKVEIQMSVWRFSWGSEKLASRVRA